MTREQAIAEAQAFKAQSSTHESTAPKMDFTEYRCGLPEQCLTKHFMQFASQVQSGLEIRNIFSIYSKLMVVCPEFVEQYIKEGPCIVRPIIGDWNLKELVMNTYALNEAGWRIIEQERIPDKYGTARSGFEALQSIFIKGLQIGQKLDCGDYSINGVVFENKGESGRMIGQERLFNVEAFKAALDNCSRRYKTKTVDKALRKSGNSHAELILMLGALLPQFTEEQLLELVSVYNSFIMSIPGHYDVVEKRAYCIKRATKKCAGEWGVKAVVKTFETSTNIREKEVFRYVCGLAELYVYCKHAGFRVLDLCETASGRILSIEVAGKSIKELDKALRNRIRFYGGIGFGTRDGAHQIGFTNA